MRALNIITIKLLTDDYFQLVYIQVSYKSLLKACITFILFCGIKIYNKHDK